MPVCHETEYPDSRRETPATGDTRLAQPPHGGSGLCPHWHHGRAPAGPILGPIEALAGQRVRHHRPLHGTGPRRRVTQRTGRVGPVPPALAGVVRRHHHVAALRAADRSRSHQRLRYLHGAGLVIGVLALRHDRIELLGDEGILTVAARPEHATLVLLASRDGVGRVGKPLGDERLGFEVHPATGMGVARGGHVEGAGLRLPPNATPPLNSERGNWCLRGSRFSTRWC